jgi:hypothetical protein
MFLQPRFRKLCQHGYSAKMLDAFVHILLSLKSTKVYVDLFYFALNYDMPATKQNIGLDVNIHS